MNIYRATALAHYRHRREADVIVEAFSGRVVVALWIVLAILVLGGMWLIVSLNGSLPNA
jgi:hypothetical protein